MSSLSPLPAVHIEEEAGCNPGHVCGVRLAALELRLEYMGTPVLLARVSQLRAALRDEWLARTRLPAPQPHRPTSRYVLHHTTHFFNCHIHIFSN